MSADAPQEYFVLCIVRDEIVEADGILPRFRGKPALPAIGLLEVFATYEDAVLARGEREADILKMVPSGR